MTTPPVSPAVGEPPLTDEAALSDAELAEILDNVAEHEFPRVGPGLNVEQRRRRARQKELTS